MRPSDVTALLLTIGEPYAERARASVARLVPPAAEIVVVRDTVPFHRAVNAGVARIRTPYFVQVDADMTLDPTCVADLRACVAERVGVVIGHLRDPLLGRVAGVKLFRRACFERHGFRDSISPDTDFYNAIAADDWRTVYAIKHAPDSPAHVFGDHTPEYSPLYTFRKYMLQGARHRYRRSAASLRELFQRLHASRHETARIALIATAYGIFLPTERDLLEPFRATTAACERVAALVGTPSVEALPAIAIQDLDGLDIRAAWKLGYHSGHDLYGEGASSRFLTTVDHLAAIDDTIAWVTLVALCRGFLAESCDADALAVELAQLTPILPRPYRRNREPSAPALRTHSDSISSR